MEKNYEVHVNGDIFGKTISFKGNIRNGKIVGEGEYGEEPCISIHIEFIKRYLHSIQKVSNNRYRIVLKREDKKKVEESILYIKFNDDLAKFNFFSYFPE